jgi:hypothetical protein
MPAMHADQRKSEKRDEAKTPHREGLKEIEKDESGEAHKLGHDLKHPNKRGKKVDGSPGDVEVPGDD